VAPRPLAEVRVAYPDALLERDEPPGGSIRVGFVVGVDGIPREVAVERGVDPALDAVVVEAVERLRYEAATYQGTPVEVKLAVEVELSPPSPSSEAEAEAGAGADAGADANGPDDPPAESTPVARLEGTVLVAAARTPVVAADITIVPLDEQGQVRSRKLRAGRRVVSEEAIDDASLVSGATDAEGRFSMELSNGVATTGAVRVIIQADGYRTAEWNERIEIAPGTTSVLEVKYFLEPDEREAYRTVVTTDARREEVGRKTLSIEEVNSLPGNTGDALKSLQTMPGVARPPLGAGLLVIRGAAPFNSAVYFAEHGIPLVFHFGALSTAVNSDVLDTVSFVPSNYDVRWGNAIGGVVHLEPRKGRRDGVHGYVDADLFDAGALLEGPVGKGSYLLSLRRSYIDAVLPAVLPEGSLQFTRAPRYWDYSGFLDHPVGDGNLSVRVLGGDDQLGFVSGEPNDDDVDTRNQSSAAASVHRADISYQVERGPWTVLVSPSIRWEYADGVSGNSLDLEVRRQAFSTRAQIGRQLSRWASIEFGTESLLMWYQIDAVSAPFSGSAVPSGEDLLPSGASSLDQQVVQESRDFSTTLSLYASTTLGAGTPVRVIPGVRLNHWGFPMYAARVDPRLRVVWDVADRTQIRGGVGRFTQTPVFQDLTEAFGNPNLTPLDAIHTTLEVEQTFASQTHLTVSGFFNALHDLPAPTDRVELDAGGGQDPVRLDNTGRGRVYGAELLLKKDLTRALLGWVSYTLMRSERQDRPRDPWYRYDYDQTHILTLVGAVLLPRHWRIGARFRLASGNPTTPVVGARFDAQAGVYAPIEGRRNADRLPLFHQLDLRVDRSFYWRYLNLNVYLDVQNAYNHPNVELYAYAHDYRSRATVTGLPILPSLGLKLAF